MQTNIKTENLPTAYATNVTHGLLQKSIMIADIIEALLLVDKDNEVFKFVRDKVVVLVGDVEKIPNFLHPIIHKGKAFIDARAYVTKEGNIRNYYEYSLLVKRALIDLAWVEDKEIFFGQENLIIDAFSSWFSFGLQRNTNANLITATNYRIIAAIYYLGIFSNEHILKDDDVITLILKKLPRIIRIPAQFIDDLIALNETAIIALYKCGNGGLSKIHILADTLTVLTDESFKIDTGIIYNSLCRGAFIAANAIEISSIAIEHPPTFVAMMYCVTQKGLQQHTNLGRVVAGLVRKYDMEHFDRFISEIATLGD